MKVNSVWQQVDGILNTIDFEKLWKGFKRYRFALYDDEKVYFGDRVIEIDNRFRGNTSIDYDGEKIAIWNVTEEDLHSIEVLACNIVHEMFHAFQLDNEEKRFPNDIKGLDKPLEVEYYGMKKREAGLLVESLATRDERIKSSNLIKIVSLRDKRSKLWKIATEYEFRIETVEGAAEYVGTIALKAIDDERYKERITKYSQIIMDNERLFDTRRYSYFYGALLLILLDSMNIQFPEDIKDNPKTIMEELLSRISQRVQIERVAIDPAIEEEMTRYRKDLFDRFDKFHASHRKNHLGRYNIIGYDPMNMYKREKEILHERWVLLHDCDKDQPISIEGPVITVYNEDESQIVDYIT